MQDALIFEHFEVAFNELLAEPGELFLVSPFTSYDAVSRLLGSHKGLEKIIFVTRWRLEDITQGVSDVEIYPLVKRLGGDFLINNRLHAKYYRKGSAVLVGSANLTQNGFSIDRPGNLELLTVLRLEKNQYSDFEAELLRDAVLVTDELYMAARNLKTELFPIISNHSQVIDLPKDEPIKIWWPESRNPENLWLSYTKREDSRGSRDLNYLSIPVGISNEELFKRVVMTSIELQPQISKIINFVKESDRRFGEMRNFIGQIDPGLRENEITIAWQNLFRWFLYLNPERFEYFRPNYSEIIRYNTPETLT
jgi:hypothetical protein